MRARRVGVLFIAVALALSPVVAGLSTRGVHDTIWNTFEPDPVDLTAIPEDPEDVTINCGPDSSHDRMWDSSDPDDGDHNRPDGFENVDFSAVGDNDRLPCWKDSTEAGDYSQEASLGIAPDAVDDPCGDLWSVDVDSDDDGTPDRCKIVGASPPGYTCTAQKIEDGTVKDVELDINIQNPFPIQKTGAGNPAETGVLVSTGTMFVVPEISGADASEITSIWFGFLETIPTEPNTGVGGGDLCEGAPKTTVNANGAYYEFYRGDIDGSDGWTIPINTLLVPDGTYGAYLKVFGDLDTPVTDESQEPQLLADRGEPSPGGSELLATGYVYATVDNSVDDEPGAWRSCTPTRASCTYQDIQPPWAQVRPGDTPLVTDPNSDQFNADELTISFGEHVNLNNLEIYIVPPGETLDKSKHQQSTLGTVTHATADVDSVPLAQVLDDFWGEEIVLGDDEALVNPLQDGTTVVITATDLHGNTATKEITLST